MARISEILARFFGGKPKEPRRPIFIEEFRPRQFGESGKCYHLKFPVSENGEIVDKSFDFHQRNDDDGWHNARYILWQHGITDLPEKFKDVTQEMLSSRQIELTHGIPYIYVDQ